MRVRRSTLVGAAVAAVALAFAAGTAFADSGGPSAPRLTKAEQQEATTADGNPGLLAPPVYQPDYESSYVPMRPCTIVDTRKGTGTNGKRIGDGATRTYYVGGTTGFADQGGKATGCGVPVGATAIDATFIIKDPKHKGTLKAWAAGGSAPGVSASVYRAVTLAASGTIPINTGSALALSVKNAGGPTDLLISVNGYYQKPLAGFISSSGQPYSGSSRIIGATHIGTGVYEVQFDRSVRYCSATTTAYVSAYYTSASTWYDSSRPDTVRVWVWNNSGTPIDQYFYISVEC